MNTVPLNIVSTASFIRMPIIAVGIVPTMISHAKRFSGTSTSPLLNTSRPSVRSSILSMKPFIRFIMSFQKKENIAINVPMCKTVSNASPVSTPSKCGISARCPELLMGRNSLSPCTAPRIIALSMSSIIITPIDYLFHKKKYVVGG